MPGGILLLLKRAVYVVIGLVGLSMVLSAYPPPPGELPALLMVGAVLALAGVAGAIWPDKITSGSSGPD